MNVVKILNALRADASENYQNNVPVATQNNITQIGNPILQYQSIQNEFCNLLVNKIAFSVVTSRIAENPLALLRKGSVPYGQDIEDIFVNMAKAETYDPDGKDLLKRNLPDVKAVYYRMNRQDKYKVSISQEQLSLAFTDLSQMEKLINGIINSLYSGDNKDEFIIMKSLVAAGFNNGLLSYRQITNPTDESTGKALVKAIRTASGLFKFPSSDYNKYSTYAQSLGMQNVSPVETWTPIENQILLVTTEVLANVDVDVLAAAFNMDKASFMGRVIEVDKFDEDGNIKALLCDEALFQVWDNMTKMAEFFNGEGLYWQYIWHHWQTFALSPFANAMAFVVNAPGTKDGPTAINVLNGTNIKMKKGGTHNIELGFTDNDDEVVRSVTFAVDNPSIIRVSEGGRITAINKGRAVITITANEPYDGTGTDVDPYLYASATINVQVGKTANITDIDIGGDIELTGVGDTETLEITITPSDGDSPLSYSSSNPEVFTVVKDATQNNKCTLTAVGTGSATLTVTTGTVTDIATVTVSAG